MSDPGHESFIAARRDALLTARVLFVDHVRWSVYELTEGPYDRRSASSLVFECEQMMRRVRDFPAEWRALSDEDLFALSWRA